MVKIPIYIGTEPNQWLPTEVLRWSVTSRTDADVEFEELKHLPTDPDLKMYTGFSFFRFFIPEINNYQGRAIYLDADIVVLDDIQKLFDMDMQGKGALSRRIFPDHKERGCFTSVMLLDCSKLTHWKSQEWMNDVKNNKELYRNILNAAKGGYSYEDFGDLPPFWNHLDEFNEETKIIHYTDVPNQPWKKAGHPHAHVFLKELKDAVEADEIPLDAIEREIRHGHIYPEIIEDMKKV